MKLKEHIASIGAIGRMRIHRVRESWRRPARSASALLGAAAVAAAAIGASGCGGELPSPKGEGFWLRLKPVRVERPGRRLRRS